MPYVGARHSQLENAVKLILTITRSEDADHLINALIEHEFRATRINSAGGFLRRGNATILVGVADEYTDDVVNLIRDYTAHANVFVLNVGRFERL